jgi:hypothetical protein
LKNLKFIVMNKTILLLAFVFSIFFMGNAQSPEIGIVGPAANGWPPDSNGNPTDIMLTDNGDGTYSIDALTLTTGSAKFRENQAWNVSHGGDQFPSGPITNGDIPVQAGVYDIVLDLNNNTYTFTDVGSFTEIELSGSAVVGSNPQMATVDGENYELTVTEFQDGDLVFQEVGTSNTFGAASFPSGTATAGGANIPVTAGFYEVTFNLNTGNYSFNIPDVGLVGPGISQWPDGNNATPDVLMNSTDGNIYTLSNQNLLDGEVKFRQNQSWDLNWGSTDFPSGSLVPGGPDNIPATAGTYDITFNRSALTFEFEQVTSANGTALITGYIDSTCSGANGRTVEIYVDGTVDFSSGWTLQRQANGGGFTTDIDISGLGSVTDSFVYVTNDAATLDAEFSINTNVIENGSISSNGDDAFQLSDDADNLIDRFGEDGVDGTGTAWEHENTYVYRNDGSMPNNGSFDASNWTFGALDLLNNEGSCNGGNPFSDTVPFGSFSMNASSTAQVQIIHNAADPAAQFVDVYLDGNLIADDFEFRNATTFLDVPAETPIDIDVAPENSTDVSESIYNLNTTLTADETYIAVANGVIDPTQFDASVNTIDFNLDVFAGAQQASTNAGETSVLVHHGSTDAATVDVVNNADQSVLVDDISYTEFDGYLDLPNQDYTINVEASDNSAIVQSYEANLQTLGLADAAVTVVASGFLDATANQNGPAFGLWVALPAGGPLVELPLATIGTDEFADNNFNYYPNPVEQRLNLNTNDLVEDVTMYNVLGKEVLDVQPEQKSPQINMSGLQSGAYMMKVTIDGVSQSFRVIKK